MGDFGNTRWDVTTGDAIIAAAVAVYPDQPQPLVFGTKVTSHEGGPDQLDSIFVFRANEPTPHWHYMTVGLSDVHATAPSRFRPCGHPVSGFGFELTFRLADPRAVDDDAEPPIWPAGLLQHLAHYVYQSGIVFGPGHSMSGNGPMSPHDPTELVSGLFVQDPDLGALETPSGMVEFVQLVGITSDELRAVQRWNGLGMAEQIKRWYPKLVTDLSRTSVLRIPGMADQIEAAIREEGSSQSALLVRELMVHRDGKDVVVEVDALTAGEMIAGLPSRLNFGNPMALIDHQGTSVYFFPHSANAVQESVFGEVEIFLTADGLAALTHSVRPEPGEYAVPGLAHLVFRIRPRSAVYPELG